MGPVMRPTLRQATKADHDRLEEVQRLASLATGDHHKELLDNPDVFGVADEHLPNSLVAEANGEVIGFCTVLPISSESAELDAIFVDPSAWRRGIGTLLLAEAEQRASSAGALKMWVTSGGYAISFYRSLGFQSAGMEITDFGPAERLVKELKGAEPG